MTKRVGHLKAPCRFALTRQRGLNRLGQCSAIVALCLSYPTFAQSSPDLSLPAPTPSPTPTGAPQGPFDERAGVRIPPRTITQGQSGNAPETLPQTQPQTQPTPAATASPGPTLPAPTSPTPARATPNPQPSTARPTSRPNRNDGVESGQSPAVQSPSAPSRGPIVADEIPQIGESAPIGPNDWYDVTPEGDAGTSTTQTSAPAGSTGQTSAQTPTGSAGSGTPLRNGTYLVLAILALMAVLLGFLFWRHLRRKASADETEGAMLTQGIRTAMTEGQSDAEGGETSQTTQSTADAEFAPPPPAKKRASSRNAAPQIDPAKLLPTLDIISATRSLMMFSIDVRIEICNRSALALRDLNVAAQLACAQRGESNAPSIAGGQPLGKIDRIAPQQRRSISGSLALPIGEIKAIRQGSIPLFIPLLHVTLEGAGLTATHLSFVIGTPSQSGGNRVQPLSLDGPPGGLPALRAQQIKSD